MRRSTMLPQIPSPLEEEDAILAEDIETRLHNYLATEHADIRLAGEPLSSNYNGAPDAIRIMLDWASMFTPDSASLLRQATEAAVHTLELKFLPLVNEALSRSNFSLPQVAAVSANPHWNQFFNKLAARHENSVLANALKREAMLTSTAIQKATLDNPNAFCKEFANLLTTYVAGNTLAYEHHQHHHHHQRPTVMESTHFFQRISVLCTFDENVTTTALYLLARLSKEARWPLTRLFFRRLAQHVRKEAVVSILDIQRQEKESPIIAVKGLSSEEAKMHVATIMVRAECTVQGLTIRADLVDAIFTVIMSRKDVGDFRTARSVDDEVAIVTVAYSFLLGEIVFPHVKFDDDAVTSDLIKNEHGDKLVLIRLLCHDEVLESLFDAAFCAYRRPTPTDDLNKAKKLCLCILLAFAITFVETEDEEVVSQLESATTHSALRSKVKDMFSKVEQVVTLCETLKPGSPKFLIDRNATNVLVTATRDAFLARGVLIWARDCLQGGSNLRDLRMTASSHLAFLSMVADKHVALRAQVVDAIGQAMVRKYPGLYITEVTDLQSRFMSCLLALLPFNMAYLVADAFVRYMADDTAVDLSHLRRFVHETLRNVTPPFSKAFAETMLKLIAHPRLESVVREREMAKIIATFRRGIRNEE